MTLSDTIARLAELDKQLKTAIEQRHAFKNGPTAMKDHTEAIDAAKIRPIYEQLCALKMLHPNLVQLEWLDTLKALCDVPSEGTTPTENIWRRDGYHGDNFLAPAPSAEDAPTPRMNAAANRAEDQGEPWAYSLLHVLEEGKKIEVELTEVRELCDRLTKERDEARAMANLSSLAVDATFECFEDEGKACDQLREENARLTQSNESLQAQCDRVNAENRDLRAKLTALEAQVATPTSVQDALDKIDIGRRMNDNERHRVESILTRYKDAEVGALREQLDWTKQTITALEAQVKKEGTVAHDALTALVKTQGELEASRAGTNRIVKLLIGEKPWGFLSSVSKLCDATRHLRDHHDCDTHGHEAFWSALESVETDMPELHDLLAAMQEGAR